MIRKSSPLAFLETREKIFSEEISMINQCFFEMSDMLQLHFVLQEAHVGQ